MTVTAKEKKLPALYIGRFQPFHMGHLDALTQILSKEKSIIIGIGSSQYSRNAKNPFTAGERLAMIFAALHEKKLFDRIHTIVLIPDIHDNSLWVRHVERLSPPFGAIYSGEPLVQHLFKEDGRHRVFPLIMRENVSGTQTRQWIKARKSYKKFLSSSVFDLLVQWAPTTLWK